MTERKTLDTKVAPKVRTTTTRSVKGATERSVESLTEATNGGHTHRMDPMSIATSEEMLELVDLLMFDMYSMDGDNVVFCPGATHSCLRNVVDIFNVFPDQNAVIVKHLRKALYKAQRTWAKEMEKAVRRAKRDLQTDRDLTPGFILDRRGLFLVLQEHKNDRGGSMSPTQHA